MNDDIKSTYISFHLRRGSVRIFCFGTSLEKKNFPTRQTLLLGGPVLVKLLHISISRIMETEQSWDKLRYSQILVRNQIINFKSATELLNLMASKNFTISHFLKICIEDNLLPYPRCNPAPSSFTSICAFQTSLNHQLSPTVTLCPSSMTSTMATNCSRWFATLTRARSG